MAEHIDSINLNCDNESKRPCILMLAFACEPDEGSEPEVGWKWANVMAGSCEVTVVTQEKNRSRVERWLREHPEEDKGIRFTYLELSQLWRYLKKRLPGGMYLYYALWQWRLRGFVSELLLTERFDIIHHVTFASFRMPVFAGGKPVVWGPVGGAETASMPLLAGHGTFLGRMRERFRNLNTWLGVKCVHLWDPSVRSGGIALASTPATAQILKDAGIPCHLMPTIGFEAGMPFVKTEPRDASEPLRLIYVGRLHLLKGVHLLLQAVTKLDPDRIRLTIVGDGSERKRLRHMAEDLRLGDIVTFCGFVPRTRLHKLYTDHDVLVAPSLYESGGLSVLEAFSHGLPAIVLDCGGHSISVSEGCGIKVPLCDDSKLVVQRLAEAIQSYVNDQYLCISHGRAARQRLDSFYSWEKKQQSMIEVYQSVINQTHT